MRKLLALLLIVALALPLSMGLFASAQEELPLYTGNVFINDGAAEVYDNKPLYIKGVTYLPVAETAAKVKVEKEVKLDSEVVYGEIAYAPAKELATALGVYYYENKLNDLVYLFDDSAALKDGEFTVWSSADSRGNAARVILTVAGGKITAAKFDEQSLKTGEWKFADGKYVPRWKERYPDVDPDALLAKGLEQLVAVQTPSKIDAMTGATSTYEKLVELSSLALGKAKYEQLNPSQVQEYRDGKYEVVGLTDGRGYTPVLKMHVAAGKITFVEYNEYGPNGMVKRNNGDYLGRWTAAYAGVDPMKMLVEREAQLIKMQDPNMVDAMTGATSWHKNLVDLAAGALDHAARTQEGTLTPNDGLYYVKGEIDSRGYTPILLAEIKDGVITNIKYHEINKSFVSKRNDAAYITRWENSKKVKPLELLAEMEKLVLEKNSFDAVDAVSGATGWAESIKELGKDIMVKAAQETTYVFKGASTAKSAYFVQMLVEANANKEITSMNYKEYQNSTPIPKHDNPSYITRWVDRRKADFPNLNPLYANDLMIERFMETKDANSLDVITSATNWRKGIKETGVKALEWIK